MVIPPSTVAIQNPVAVVDKNAETHCVEDVANAFVEFLHTPDAAAIYDTVGLRASGRPHEGAGRQGRGDHVRSRSQDLFTTDDLGGWDDAVERHRVRPERRVHAGTAGRAGIDALSAETLERTTDPRPEAPGAGPSTSRAITAAAGRWGLRGIALLYLGLMVGLPPSP